METTLAGGEDWLLGDDYTLADISLSPYVARLQYLTLLPIWIENRPLVMAWWERARRRRSFEIGVEKALKNDEKADMATYGERIRDRVRGASRGISRGISLNLANFSLSGLLL